jgi:hypothetical protein
MMLLLLGLALLALRLLITSVKINIIYLMLFSKLETGSVEELYQQN